VFVAWMGERSTSINQLINCFCATLLQTNSRVRVNVIFLKVFHVQQILYETFFAS
jgi:hypothetical protein